ncbi:MAG: pilus assembly protein [Chloroflexi bacterium]|nr:pilus assembly protein [Chloroflexota bacterium]
MPMTIFRRRVSGSMPGLRQRAVASDAGDGAGGRSRRQRGQALAEFAIIIPLLFLLVMSIIEFALAFNSSLGINRASQNAALIAAEAGNLPGADCMILLNIEQDITAPIDKREITGIEIQRTNPSGTTIFSRNTYTRTGQTQCPLADGTLLEVPYTATSTGYPVNQRCSVLSGCPTMVPARTTVDTIGIQINLRYNLRTPLNALMAMFGGGTSGTMDFVQRSAFRMEPQL